MRSPICIPRSVPTPKTLSLRERISRCLALRSKFAHQRIVRSYQRLCSMENGMSCYDYNTLVMLSLATEHNLLKPWFLSRLEVGTEIPAECMTRTGVAA